MTNRAVLTVLAALTITACGGSSSEPIGTNPPAVSGEPGDTIDLNATFSALIGAPGTTGVVWSVGGATAAVSAGLAVTPEGLLTLPGCSIFNYGGQLPTTVVVEARSGSTVVFSASITVDERYLGAAVSCYLLQNESLCRDPNGVGGVVYEAGKTITFFTATRTTCRTSWSPVLPEGACPANDPAFTFCR